MTTRSRRAGAARGAAADACRAASDGLARVRSSTTSAATSATASSSTSSSRRTTCGSASPPTRGRPTGRALRAMGFEYFCFLSAIDWMPSPFGRGEDDPTQPPPERTTEVVPGIRRRRDPLPGVRQGRPTSTATSASRSRPTSPDDTLAVDSWHAIYAGANWHERETHEMFGIGFNGHPDLRNMYLPDRVRGLPAAQGLPAARPHGEAVAGHRRRRADARGGARASRPPATSRRPTRSERSPTRRPLSPRRPVEDAPAHPAAEPDDRCPQPAPPEEQPTGDAEPGDGRRAELDDRTSSPNASSSPTSPARPPTPASTSSSRPRA